LSCPLKNADAEKKVLMIIEELCNHVIQITETMVENHKSPSNISPSEINQKIFTFSHQLMATYKTAIIQLSKEKQKALQELMNTIHAGIAEYHNQEKNTNENTRIMTASTILNNIKTFCETCKTKAQTILGK
jgi:hypothetical protein